MFQSTCLFFFFPRHVACRILILWPGIEHLLHAPCSESAEAPPLAISISYLQTQDTTIVFFTKLKKPCWDFPRGPVVKNLPCKAGDSGLKHAVEQLNPCASTTELARMCFCSERSHVLWLRPNLAK